MAHAVTSEQVPNEVVTNGTVDQRRVSSLELSRANERRDQLLNEGFLKKYIVTPVMELPLSTMWLLGMMI
ncbi:hypothetical protein [Corynebacterium diphtheriae]|uniref:hypothetical protein n=1 Tax=Corynebacterium diphtheriae TaxID=1717 RepID=UPI000A902D11|nr:hypothetical protein [Corynebacterium diphtheriae]